ncbi:MAG TPA: PIN domain-containing protein [Thermoanaerobaculia bacterium]|nr:PIN domain-containing protein [Thermoanaerobaculia bacterium]
MILLDTSGLLAALFEDQNHHEACAQALLRATPPRILSPFVLAEADYLIQKFGGIDAELMFLDEVGRGVFEMTTFDESDVRQAREIVAKYHDLSIGLADASIVVLAGRYDCRDVLTLDFRHFRALRPPGRRSFRILPAGSEPA